MTMLEEVTRQRNVLRDVADERMNQDEKWGAIEVRNTPFDTWYRVLGEEFGEVAIALNDKEPIENLRAELVQVAAVAVAWVEYIDMLQSPSG